MLGLGNDPASFWGSAYFQGRPFSFNEGTMSEIRIAAFDEGRSGGLSGLKLLLENSPRPLAVVFFGANHIINIHE